MEHDSTADLERGGRTILALIVIVVSIVVVFAAGLATLAALISKG